MLIRWRATFADVSAFLRFLFTATVSERDFVPAKGLPSPAKRKGPINLIKQINNDRAVCDEPINCGAN